MSLLIPRPMEERASVILPTVTCSSCSAPIPLSSLGDHVCRAPPPVPSHSQSSSYAHAGYAGPSTASAPRQVPRPQLSIPLDPPRPAHSHSLSPLSAGSPGSFNRPFARSPLGSSAGSSPAGSFNAQLPSHQLHAPSNNSGQRTPSPTNPFFPQNRSPERSGNGSSISKGPFPTDAPLPPGGVHGLQEGEMPDMTSGGNAGMAGVGRRAFAAAAWGVRAGVALAQGVAQSTAQAQQQQQQQQQQGGYSAQPVRRPSHDQTAAGGTAFPQAHTQQPRVTSPVPSDNAAYPRPAYPGQRSGSPSQREPPLLPKVPLKNRPRVGGPSRSNSYDTAEEEDALKRKPSDTKQFFDRYKAMVAASSSTDTSPIMTHGASVARGPSDRTDLRVPGPSRKGSYSREEEDDDLPSALPWAIPADDVDPPDIARLGLSDKVKIPNVSTTSGTLGRHKTGQSSSSNTSGTSGRSGRSAPDQEVVTPSQSWEGFADRRQEYKVDPAALYAGKHPGAVGLGFEIEDGERERSASRNDYMEQIREDEEERDQVVFGARLGPGSAAGMKPSTSDSSLSADASDCNPYRAHSRAQTAPEHHAAPLSTATHGLSRTPSANHAAAHALMQSPPSDYGRDRNNDANRSDSISRTQGTRALGSSTASNSGRRPKVCVKCSEAVGGSKRFVERDGVVLCERDWKKMYLPSCRKCRLPIEKSAVSSSDGQLKGKWHRACFTCTRCDKGFETDDFYVLEGRPWCQYHYHEEK
jgi:hypothetical protein